jgi:hypothetical protein
MRRIVLSIPIIPVALAVACSKQPSETSPPHTTEATAPAAEAGPAPAAPSAARAPTPAVADSAPAAPPAPEEPPPNVKVISIGMHVAGGPFDEETKKPFLKAVEPRYAELARCFKHVSDKSRTVDVGVDLLIPPSGGKPKVGNPRTTVPSEGLLPCVVAFFESVEFDKPKSGGPQGLSYSVRFKPGK